MTLPLEANVDLDASFEPATAELVIPGDVVDGLKRSSLPAKLHPFRPSPSPAGAFCSGGLLVRLLFSPPLPRAAGLRMASLSRWACPRTRALPVPCRFELEEPAAPGCSSVARCRLASASSNQDAFRRSWASQPAAKAVRPPVEFEWIEAGVTSDLADQSWKISGLYSPGRGPYASKLSMVDSGVDMAGPLPLRFQAVPRPGCEANWPPREFSVDFGKLPLAGLRQFLVAGASPSRAGHKLPASDR